MGGESPSNRIDAPSRRTEPASIYGLSRVRADRQNAGFWDDLVDGFTKLNERPGPGVVLEDGSVSHKAPLGFWKFHQVPSL